MTVLCHQGNVGSGDGFWSLHCKLLGNFALSWVELEEINFKSQLGEVELRSPSVRRRVYLCLYRASAEESQA